MDGPMSDSTTSGPTNIEELNCPIWHSTTADFQPLLVLDTKSSVDQYQELREAHEDPRGLIKRNKKTASKIGCRLSWWSVECGLSQGHA